MKLTYTPLTHGSSGISTWIFCKLRDTKLGASKRSLWPDCTQTRKVLVTSVQFSSVPQSCLTLFDPMNRSTPGLRVHQLVMSKVFGIPWTVALQDPLFMEFSRPKYLSEQPCLSPGDLPDPEIKLRSPALQADSLPTELPGKPTQTRAYGKKFCVDAYCMDPVEDVKQYFYSQMNKQPGFIYSVEVLAGKQAR